jgi:hypothetical protein
MATMESFAQRLYLFLGISISSRMLWNIPSFAVRRLPEPETGEDIFDDAISGLSLVQYERQR